MRRPPRAFRKSGPRGRLARAEVGAERLDGLRRPAGRSAPSGPCRGPARSPRGGRRPPRRARTARRRAPRWRRGPRGSRGPAGPPPRRPEAGRNSASLWSIGRCAGSRPGRLGVRTSRAGFTRARPRRIRKRKKLRRVARRRAIDVRASPRSWRSARYPRTTRASASASAPSPRRSRKRETVEEVGPVAPDRVRRGAPLGREVPEERGHRRPARLAAGRLHALSVSRR